MTGYVRNDVTDQIANGLTIDAIPLDGEFEALAAAFVPVTGHAHNGSVGEGGAIVVVGPAQDVVVTANSVTPKTDNTVDLGAVGFEWKDLYVDGTANIDSLVADTADINAGTIDGTVIGATIKAAVTGTTITGDSLVGPLTGNVTGALTGNASTATTLQTTRTISLSGDATGSTPFNGGADVIIPVVVANDSHQHTLSTITDAGTMAAQNSGTVAITGGSVTGIIDLAIADGGTGASTAIDARTNLGLGSIATQNSDTVSITGGSITGITDLAIADGGTGASTASAARTNLDLANVHAGNFLSGNVDIGQEGAQRGTLDLFGSPTGSSGGGVLNIYTADDNDDVLDSFQISAVTNDLRIRANGSAINLLYFDGGLDSWDFYKPANFQAGVTGLEALQATWDAGTDTTESTITPAKLAGAIAAQVNGGLTLLGTLATTSGSSQTLSSLDLTEYKALRVIFAGVSLTTTGYVNLDGKQVAPSSAVFSAGVEGILDLDLTAGYFTSIAQSVSSGNSIAVSEVRLAGTTYSTASTSITFTTSAGSFDAGAIYVYGVK